MEMDGWDLDGRLGVLPDSEDDEQRIEPDNFLRCKKKKSFPLPSGFRVQSGTKIAVHFHRTKGKEEEDIPRC